MQNTGIMEPALARGTGLRCRSHSAFYLSDIDYNIAAAPIGGAGSVLVDEWTELALIANAVPFCSTVVAQIVQTSAATGWLRLRVRGIDQFGDYVDEITPIIAIEAKTNNWIYLAKVFSWIISVEFMSLGLDIADDTINLGQYFNWTRTVDANNAQHYGKNLGFALFSKLGKQRVPDNEVGVLNDTSVFIQEPKAREDEIILDVTFTPTLPLNNSTVTIYGKVYTFKTVLAATDGFVLIGATLAACALNLQNAINLGPGAGTTYGANTTRHPTVTATGPGDSTGTVKYHWNTPGSQGNFLTNATTVVDAVFVILQGGQDGPDRIEFTVESNIDAGGTYAYYRPAQFATVIGYSDPAWDGPNEKIHIATQATVATWTLTEQAIVRSTVITGAAG